MSSFSLPRAKRHQVQAPSLNNEIPIRAHVHGDHFQNTNLSTTSAIGNEVMVAGGMGCNNPSQGLNDLSNPNGGLVGGPGQVITQASTLDYQDVLDPKDPK